MHSRLLVLGLATLSLCRAMPAPAPRRALVPEVEAGQYNANCSSPAVFLYVGSDVDVEGAFLAKPQETQVVFFDNLGFEKGMANGTGGLAEYLVIHRDDPRPAFRKTTAPIRPWKGTAGQVDYLHSLLLGRLQSEFRNAASEGTPLRFHMDGPLDGVRRHFEYVVADGLWGDFMTAHYQSNAAVSTTLSKTPPAGVLKLYEALSRHGRLSTLIASGITLLPPAALADLVEHFVPRCAGSQSSSFDILAANLRSGPTGWGPLADRRSNTKPLLSLETLLAEAGLELLSESVAVPAETPQQVGASRLAPWEHHRPGVVDQFDALAGGSATWRYTVRRI